MKLCLYLVPFFLVSSCADSDPVVSKTSPPDSNPASAAAPLKIEVDQSHNHAGGVENPKFYRLSATKELILDTSDFKTEISSQPCNSIQVIAGGSNKYSLDFDPEAAEHVISAATLKPNPGSGPFEGISEQETTVIAIGLLEPADGKMSFSVRWAGMINGGQ